MDQRNTGGICVRAREGMGARAQASGPGGPVGARAGLLEAQLARKGASGLGGCLLKLGVMAGGSELTNTTASSFLLNPLNYRIHVQVHGRKIAVFILLDDFKSILFIKAYCLSL